MTIVLNNVTKGVDMNYLGWNINSSLDGMFPILTANLPYNTELDENDEVQLKEGTDIKFGGYISKIEQDERGLFTVTIKGYGYEILDKKITLDLASTSPENVLTQAVSGTSYSISAPATGITLTKYKITDRRKIVFSEMKEETGRFLRVVPDKTIYFEESGAIAKTKSYTSANSKVLKNERDPDQIINDIEVYGEDGSGNIVKGSASNSTSITNYGEKYKRYTFDFLTSDTEANAIASKLLVPNPVETIEIKIKRDFDLNLNEIIGITDTNRNISGDYIIFSLSHRSSKETIITVGSSVMAIARKEAKIRNTVDREEARLFSEETATAEGTNVGSHTTNISGSVSSGTASVSDSGHSDHGVTGTVASGTANVSDSGHSNHGVNGTVASGTASVSDSGHSNHGVSGTTGSKVLPSGGHQAIDQTDASISSTNWTNVLTISADSSDHLAFLNIGIKNDTGTDQFFYVTLYNYHDSSYIPSSSGQHVYINNSHWWMGFYVFPLYANDDCVIEVKAASSSGTCRITGNMGWINAHSHSDGTLTDGTGTANVSDSGHQHTDGTLTDGTGTANVSDSGHQHTDGTLTDGTGTANVSDSGHAHNNTFTGDAQTFNLSLGLTKKINVLNRKNR